MPGGGLCWQMGHSLCPVARRSGVFGVGGFEFTRRNGVGEPLVVAGHEVCLGHGEHSTASAKALSSPR